MFVSEIKLKNSYLKLHYNVS